MAILTRMGVPGDEAAWLALGFDVVDGTVTIGRVVCDIGRAPTWSFDEVHADAAALGIPTTQESPVADAGVHDNLIDRIDHPVYVAPDLDTAVDAFTAVLGEPPRRRFHPRGPTGPEMAFFRTGESFIEVVEGQVPTPRLIGVAFNSPDLDTTVDVIKKAGGPVGDPKPAVQGGRIASVWRGHMDFGIAIMGP